MGNSISSIIGWVSIGSIIRKLDDSNLPDDRETIVDILVILERRLKFFNRAVGIQSKQFYDAGGVPIIIRHLKGGSKDEVILRHDYIDIPKTNITLFDLKGLVLA